MDVFQTLGLRCCSANGRLGRIDGRFDTSSVKSDMDSFSSSCEWVIQRMRDDVDVGGAYHGHFCFVVDQGVDGATGPSASKARW